ncbi:MAG: molybdate ABC transporter substrate-binding protein [Eubacterium sp.]|nr:molybdate ABC transporter substrate-binding protein [Eubacterium sp.]
MKRLTALFMTALLILGLAACGSTGADQKGPEDKTGEESATEVRAGSGNTEIKVFIAASLSKVMEDLAAKYNETHPDVKITFNADSSGTLMTQIEEGFACDVFFSAAQKQMDELADKGFVVEGTRDNVVNNQLIVLTQKDSETEVTGLADLAKAKSIALADGSVPVGKYTRVALIALGILPETEDPSLITTIQVSDALGGVEISEQGNVSKVLNAVVEGSCEVGTTYYSDTYGFEDQVKVLETVSYDLTGNIIYPIAQINNEEADDEEKAAAKEFIDYITSDEAKAVFNSYYFDTNVE